MFIFKYLVSQIFILYRQLIFLLTIIKVSHIELYIYQETQLFIKNKAAIWEE